MQGRFVVSLAVLCVLVLFLTACAEPNADDSDSVGASTSPSVSSSPAGPMPAPKTATVSTDVALTSPEDENVDALPSGVFIATPPEGEVIERDVPAEPAQTESPGDPTAPSSSFDSDGDGWYSFAELQQALLAHYPSYEWPEKYQIDPSDFLGAYPGSEERGDEFQVGAEYMMIGIRHRCAWLLAWLDAFREGDTALMAESLDQLRTVTQQNPMIHVSSLEVLEEMFQRAELGDPALVQQYVDGTCRNVTFISLDEATSPTEPASSE